MIPLQNLALDQHGDWHVWVADNEPLPEKDRTILDWPTTRIPLASFRDREAAIAYGGMMGWPS